jgi:methionyl-tRNA formyltransferase
MKAKIFPQLQVGVLSTLTHPLLPRLLQVLFEFRVTGVCVLLDAKLSSEKDLRIWQERTQGVFDGGPTLYEFASHGLTLYPVESHNSEDCVKLIKRLGLSLLVNGGTPRKLSSDVLTSVRQGVVNVHPGVLPKYRGASCVEWAIYNDDRVGNTAHFMSEAYDEGPIILTESYDFSSVDTYPSIRAHVYRESLRLMGESVKKVLDQGMTSVDGMEQGAGQLFPPIPEDKMQRVLAKVAAKSYRYMRMV